MEYDLQQQTCIKKNEDQIKIVFSMSNAYVYSKINIQINFWIRNNISIILPKQFYLKLHNPKCSIGQKPVQSFNRPLSSSSGMTDKW